jgi:kinesin family member 5
MASKQVEVFNLVATPVVQSIFDGYNATIFAYGQTSAGKTHTMMGPSSDEIQGYCDDAEEKGLIPRLCESIFNRFEEAEEEMEFTVRVSYFEIYMERVRDLLDPSRTNLSIHEEKGGRGVFVDGATETFVSSVVEMYGIMQLGAQNRVVSATRMSFLRIYRCHYAYTIWLFMSL